MIESFIARRRWAWTILCVNYLAPESLTMFFCSKMATLRKIKRLIQDRVIREFSMGYRNKVFLSVIFALAVSEVTAATFYVSPAGKDSNSGTSLVQAWKTIAKANASLNAGDTVLIGAGTYSDQIRPARSGTSDAARITYRALGDGQVILTAVGSVSKGSFEDIGAIALGGRSYVTVDGVNQYIRALPDAKTFNALGNFNNAQHNIINSVYLDGSSQTGKGMCVFLFNFLYGTDAESSYNVLSNSYIAGRIGSNTQYTEDTIQVAANAHHNLIDGNTILNARHSALNIGTFTASVPKNNVIRNNIIKNPEHTALELYNNGPYLNLVEGNYVSGGGEKPVSPTNVGPGSALEYSGSESIFRYNVITQGGTTDNKSQASGGLVISVGGEGSRLAMHNRVYNNTIVKNSGTPLGVLDFGTLPGAKIGQGAFVNNFIYGASSPAGGNVLVLYWDSTQNTSDRFISNVFGNPTGGPQEKVISTKRGDMTVSSASSGILLKSVDPELRLWNGFSNTYDASPGFANYSGDDFKLSGGNKYIDAGAPLAQVAAGDILSTTTLIVDDSRFFQDGMGIPGVVADWISVGSVANIVQITSVNYLANSISLSKAIVRKKGDMVWLYSRSNGERVLYGSAPDIGAYEVMSSAPSLSRPLRAPTNLKAKP